MRTWFGYGWAAPVVSRRWALVATVMEWIKRASGYRLALDGYHRAWERAVGVR